MVFTVLGFFNIKEISKMQLDFNFFFTSIMLGIGLAMDAFAVSLANGLNEPNMKTRKMCGIAGLFSFFQALMPLIGWICIHTIVQYFESFESWIPWIALGLLGFIGGKMLIEGIKTRNSCDIPEHKGSAYLHIRGGKVYRPE
jgi:putative Mn2+ efflux pump MntP